MISSREKLQGINAQNSTHAGLWLDRYLPKQPERNERITSEQGTPQSALLKEVTEIVMPSEYQKFYEERWQPALAACGAVCRKSTVQGRMIVGLGDESVLETAVTLHQTYGVPYIPGSALKGLAASYVRQQLDDPQWGEWKPKDEKQIWEPGTAYRVMFGDTNEAGFITFFDALYVPGSGHVNEKGDPQPLWPDVITVHHPDYYQGKDRPPADWDSPTPVPFLSATGSYLVALAGQSDWVRTVFEILRFALSEVGIGAKTSSGYGRMVLEEAKTVTVADGPLPQQGEPALMMPSDPDQPIVDDMIRRLELLPLKSVANELHKFFNEWRSLQVSVPLKQQVAQAILTKVREAGREKASEGKSWYKELVASLHDEGGATAHDS